MLPGLIADVCAELDLAVPKRSEQNSYLLPLREDLAITIADLEPGASLSAQIGLCPTRKREELFTLLMQANYLGQLTGPSRIGLSQDGKYLTLSLSIPYELTYRSFRELLEDFVNFLLYWREEVVKFEAEQRVV